MVGLPSPRLAFTCGGHHHFLWEAAQIKAVNGLNALLIKREEELGFDLFKPSSLKSKITKVEACRSLTLAINTEKQEPVSSRWQRETGKP
jgi:hypothetical protein